MAPGDVGADGVSVRPALIGVRRPTLIGNDVSLSHIVSSGQTWCVAIARGGQPGYRRADDAAASRGTNPLRTSAPSHVANPSQTTPIQGAAMPVTRLHTSPAAPAAPGPAAPGPAPTPAPMPAAVVGHGTTRLLARPPAYATNAPFIPGTPPPRGETAGAHGAHKGRIAVRY